MDDSPLAALRQRYETYLKKERGLSPVTIAGYWRHLRQFLVERFWQAPLCLRELAPKDLWLSSCDTPAPAAPKSPR